jgi:peptide/nickel transport system permease protein
VRLDVGESLWTGKPIVGSVVERIPVTLELALMAMVRQVVIDLPVGVYAATHQDQVGDQVARFTAILTAAMPSFWIATIVIVFVAAWAGWLPPLGEIAPIWERPWTNLQIFFLSALILGVSGSGSKIRYTRNTLLEVIRQDYIRTAFAKGLTTRRVWYGHALKNAMIPVVTIAGSHMAGLLGGTVIIENIFALPGLGQLFLTTIRQRDIPLLEFSVLVTAFLFATANLLVDLSYAWLDPRIRYR